jgi:hypothetical protein
MLPTIRHLSESNKPSDRGGDDLVVDVRRAAGLTSSTP